MDSIFVFPSELGVETEAYAAFLQTTYEFNETLTLTTGIRYTDETKEIDNQRQSDVDNEIGTLPRDGSVVSTIEDVVSKEELEEYEDTQMLMIDDILQNDEGLLNEARMSISAYRATLDQKLKQFFKDNIVI